METVSQRPNDPAFVLDPYPFYRSIRAKGDFVFWEEYGFPVATTSAAANAVLRSPKFGREQPAGQGHPAPQGTEAFYALEAHSLLELEPPDHTRIRKALLENFEHSHVYHRAPVISQTTDELIGKFPCGPFDLLEAFAQPLPANVIADILGIPREMAEQLRAWSHAMVAMYQARRDESIEHTANDAAVEYSHYIQTILKERRAKPHNDLISRFANQTGDAQRLSDAEVISTVIKLLNSGHEATVHAIGNACRILANFDERKLALDPQNIAGTVEECLRYDPPLHLLTRYVYEDVTILDQTIKKGEKVGVLLGSACRDDAVWPDGEIFDPFRPERPNLAFGAGLHYCVGAPLSVLVLQIALPALFSRCPDLRIVESPKVADLYHYRALERLIVQV